MSDAINVGEVVDASRVGGLQVRVFVLAVAAALVDGYDTQAITYALSSMASEWKVRPQDFAPALTIGLAGLMIGGMVMGQLGDKYGRRPLVILSTVVFGVCTFAIASARSLDDLFWIRFVAGIGLGGLFPNVTTIVADYAPEARRRTAVMVVIGSLAAGAFLGGLLAKTVIPLFGWRAVFEIGGAFSLLTALICFALLPESPTFLAARDGRDPRIGPLLLRIAPRLSIGRETRFVSHLGQEKQASFSRLFAAGRAPVTILLWVAMIAQLIVVYIFSLWLPTLVKENGNPVDVSLLASSLFSLGGLAGSFLLGPISERIGPHITLAASYALVAAISTVLSGSGTNVPLLYAASFAVGIVAFGTWSALSALVTKFYPTEIRATGGGYAQGLGRIGSMLSPIIVGWALAAGWKADQVLLLPVVPACLAAICVVLIGVLRKYAVDDDKGASHNLESMPLNTLSAGHSPGPG
jgi:MFS transporter, AAHS family, 4-hydroxybenzoate transporter